MDTQYQETVIDHATWLPELIKNDVLPVIRSVTMYRIGYRKGDDVFIITDPDQQVHTIPRNDHKGNIELKQYVQLMKHDPNHELWFDDTVEDLGEMYSVSNALCMIMNMSDDEYDQLPEAEANDSHKRPNDLVFIKSKPGFMEELMAARSAYRAFLTIRDEWLEDPRNTILAYQFIDHHPIGWHLRNEASTGVPLSHTRIATSGLFSSMMGWQTYCDHHRLLVEPLAFCHDPRLDYVGSDLSDIVVNVAERIDRYYLPNGDDRSLPDDHTTHIKNDHHHNEEDEGHHES
jgi:hypothetical protein